MSDVPAATAPSPVTSAKAPAITHTEKINLSQGRHLLIVLTSDSRLNIFQSQKAPEF